MTIDLEKIEVIRVCPTLKNVSEIRSFMGLARYYKRFIEGFSKIDNPITSLKNEGIKFVWISE
jgi:hypothetical protein